MVCFLAGCTTRVRLELSRQLRNTSGKKQYGCLKPSVKASVDEIADECGSSERRKLLMVINRMTMSRNHQYDVERVAYLIIYAFTI
jgi:hypothetical protein